MTTLDPVVLLLAVGAGTVVLLVPLLALGRRPARLSGHAATGHAGRPGRRRGGRRWSTAWLPLRLLERLWAPEVRVEGTSLLRTRLIHAGQGHHTSAWVGLRQAGLTCLFSGLAAAGLWTALVPPVAAPLALAAALSAGVLLPYVDLLYRAGQRRERLRLELAPFLHALAALVAAGTTLERALAEVASEGGELTAELAEALKLRGTGVGLEETLRLMHERCATPEVTGALKCIVLARRRGEGGTGVEARVAPALRALADSTRQRLTQRRRERKERARLTSTALLVLLCLPALALSVLYPAVVMALRASH